jgi:protein-S-isoprenylcysteine O-methyltransferase Ste14
MINNKYISPALMWLLVIIGLVLIFYFSPDSQIIGHNVFTYILVISAVLYWLYFFSLAVFVNQQAALSSAKTEKLIQHGVYGLVRHPIYAADIILAWGIFLFWPRAAVFIGAVWLSLVLFYWMRLEERVLTEKFGNDYAEYKKRVPMFLPRLFRKQ